LASTKLPRSGIQGPVTPLGPADAPAVEALYREVASARNGYLDRGLYVWQRVREPRGGETRGYGVRNGSALEGYVYLQQRGAEDQRQLVVTDLVAATPEALRRLLRLVADHQSTLKTTLFHGAAHEPLLFGLSESAGRVELTDHFMLRIVHVEKALSARGYRAVDARVDFSITDPQIPENYGNFRLDVERGAPRVTRGGAGSVELDVRGLAALYTGFLPPADLARAGMLRANERELATLSDLFGGSSPAMSDFF
jgi:predicted acetyltransferase